MDYISGNAELQKEQTHSVCMWSTEGVSLFRAFTLAAQSSNQLEIWGDMSNDVTNQCVQDKEKNLKM